MLLSVVCLILSGCGGGGVPVAEVEGTVKLNGQPLEKIMVEFWPTTQGPRSIGTTDDQGHFKLKTDDGLRDGAAVGPHKIVLHDTSILGDVFLGRAAEDVDMAKGKKPRISAEYSNAESTSLTKEVKAGEKNVFDLEVNAWKGN